MDARIHFILQCSHFWSEDPGEGVLMPQQT